MEFWNFEHKQSDTITGDNRPSILKAIFLFFVKRDFVILSTKLKAKNLLEIIDLIQGICETF